MKRVKYRIKLAVTSIIVMVLLFSISFTCLSSVPAVVETMSAGTEAGSKESVESVPETEGIVLQEESPADHPEPPEGAEEAEKSAEPSVPELEAEESSTGEDDSAADGQGELPAIEEPQELSTLEGPGSQTDLPTEEEAEFPEESGSPAEEPAADPVTGESSAPEEEESAEESLEAETEETAEEDLEPAEEPEEKSIYRMEGYDYRSLEGMDFSSGRIMVGTGDPGIFLDPSVIISSYKNVYLLQFEDTATTMLAYAYYQMHGDFAELDSTISTAQQVSEEEGILVSDVMTEASNPISEMESAMASSGFGSYDIALIDTGAEGAEEMVSVLGGDVHDDNGHGTAMLQCIRKQNPGARILSIKALGANGQGDVSAVYAAIQYAISKQVGIINLSLSAPASYDSVVIENAINEAAAAGILVVGAAGNNGTDAGYYIPGGIASACIIGAADSSGLRLPSSNFGNTVDYHVAADSTSSAAAVFSGWVSLHGYDAVPGALNQGLIYAVDYVPAEEQSIETGYLESCADRSLVGEGSFHAIGFVRSTVTLADREQGIVSIDDLWARNNGMDAFLSTETYYAGLYMTSVDAPYYVARIIRPDKTIGKQLIQFLAARDNDNGEVVEGCIFDSSTGLVYIPAALIDFNQEVYVLSQIRTQLLYSIYAGTDGVFAISTSAANMAVAPGTYELSAVPQVGSFVIIDNASTTFGNGGYPWPGTDNIYYLPETWVTDDGSFPRKLLNSVIHNISSLNVTLAPGGTVAPMTVWRVVLKGGTYTLSDGVKITLSAGTFDVTCNHISLNRKFQEDASYSGANFGVPVYFKIFAKDSNYLYIALITSSSVTGQAGAGIFKIKYQVKQQTGSIKVSKTMDLSGLSTSLQNQIRNSSKYSVEGAEYTIYTDKACTSPYGNRKLVIKAKNEEGMAGTSDTISSVPLGTYYVKETKAPANTLLDPKVYTVTLSAGNVTEVQTVSSKNTPILGSVYIQKSTQAEAFCQGNRLYSLAGAVYEIYTSPDCREDTRAARLTTNEEGSTDRISLPVETYYVIETQASPGHLTDPKMSRDQPYTLQVTKGNDSDHPVKITSSEPLKAHPARIQIHKISGDYQYALPLEHVIFEICYYDNTEGTAESQPLRKWQIETLKDQETGEYQACLDQDWLLSGSDDLYLIDGTVRLPLGTYTIEEIRTAPGYTLAGGYLYPDAAPDEKTDTQGGKLTFQVSDKGDGTLSLSAGNQFTGYNRPIRIQTTALCYGAIGKPGTKYMDASANYGVIADTVRYENLQTDSRYRLTGQIYDRDTGEIIGNSAVKEFVPQKEEGSVNMLFGVIHVEQIAGHTLVAAQCLEEYRDQTWVKVAEEQDLDQEQQAVHVVKIQTTLTDDQTKNHLAREMEEVTLTDTVAHQGLIPGETYVLKGYLQDTETGETLAVKEKSFQAAASEGQEPITFTCSTRKGQRLVAFEELYAGEDLITSHKDPEDPLQSIWVPEIHTLFTDPLDGEHEAFPAKEMRLRDTVYYSNLIPQLEYTLESVLMDQDSGEPLLDGQGQPVTAQTTFTPEEAEGSTDVEFLFEGSGLAGHSLVAFERLLYHNVELTSHQDLKDPAQTVYIPRIETTLWDPYDEGKDALASEEMVLTDQVCYENLIPGKEYTLKGVLYDKETGEPVPDDQGQEITAETLFVPETPDGRACVTFRFAGLSLAGKDVVAFEELYAKTKQLAVHADIEDEAQKVDIPAIKTSLKNTLSRQEDALAFDSMVLTDTVTYENLLPGQTYTLKGVLTDQQTGEAALDDEGRQILSEITFTPETPDGEVQIHFSFSGSNLKGHTLVAFERLYREEKLTALHCDSQDFDQSVWIPRISTSLKDAADGFQDVDIRREILLTDQVAYENLLPGKEYTVKGILMDQSSGKPLLDDQGEEITAQQTFLAQEACGTLELEFRFHGRTLEGKSMVAFEELYRDGVKVAVHADINDEAQTVHVPEIKTTLLSSEAAEHTVTAGRSISLTDHVTYQNLIPGLTYTLKGILMDQSNEQPVLDDEGKEITAETRFTPSSRNGSTEIVFTFPGLSLGNHTLVAFEDLYREEKHLAVHADIQDEEQSVYVYKVQERGITPRTGDEEFLLFWVVLAAGSGAGIGLAVMILRRRRRN